MNFKKFLTVFLVFFIPIFAFFILSSQDESVAKKVDYAQKPRIVKFTSTMCMDCKKLNETMQKVYPKYSEKIVLEEIQVQNNDKYTNEQIKKYNVSLVPTIVIVDRMGNRLNKIEGYIEERDLEKIMKDLCNE